MIVSADKSYLYANLPKVFALSKNEIPANALMESGLIPVPQGKTMQPRQGFSLSGLGDVTSDALTSGGDDGGLMSALGLDSYGIPTTENSFYTDLANSFNIPVSSVSGSGSAGSSSNSTIGVIALAGGVLLLFLALKG